VTITRDVPREHVRISAVQLNSHLAWRPDCVVLHKLFQSSEVTPVLLKRYHVVTVDVGRFDRNLDIAEKYVDLHRSGIPALVVLGPDGDIWVATNDASFAAARTMRAPDVLQFLNHWAP
jgi:hypothetical protein